MTEKGWNETHTINSQHQYCYCQRDRNFLTCLYSANVVLIGSTQNALPSKTCPRFYSPSTTPLRAANAIP
ncbi:unnamed protein product [Absidia cylindrospora]